MWGDCLAVSLFEASSHFSAAFSLPLSLFALLGDSIFAIAEVADANILVLCAKNLS